jgi:hypothetical protein
MIKSWLYPGPTLSYIIGLLGVGFSMSGLPLTLQIVTVCVSLIILIFTAGIKLEEYLKKRHQRMMREEVRGFRVFLEFADKNTEDFEELDEEVIEDLEEAHDEFRSK